MKTPRFFYVLTLRRTSEVFMEMRVCLWRSDAPAMMILESEDDGRVKLFYRGVLVVDHSPHKPLLSVGRGSAHYSMHRGNYFIEDEIMERIALTQLEIEEQGDIVRLSASARGIHVNLEFTVTDEGVLTWTFDALNEPVNRVWLRIPAIQTESVYGCGEQFSHFNLRGRTFPLWVSEQGVGRNKTTYETYLADVHEKAGGDYYTTYFPQPTFVSSRKYFLHVQDSHYMEFDFRAPDHHELEIWGLPQYVWVGVEPTFPELLATLTQLLGRQPELPDWAYDGVWLGLQGGTEAVEAKLRRALSEGLKVAAIWAQDWQGKRITPFGKQLMWNWQWDRRLYPGLDVAISRWRAEGIRFLGYINAFLVPEGALYQEAVAGGYLVQNTDGEPYPVVITSFPAVMVDLTNPAAFAWLKDVIRRELIDFGLSGWMADFGEYLPTDAVLYDGDAETLHNQWPVLWAKANREAVEESGGLGEIVFFTRAGYTGTARFSTMVWAGDQNVDWSPDDGLPSVIPAALSLGMSGVGLHHSDIGGYTTLFHMKRSKELFMRWAELATFTAVMRTHEGNRPDDNWQFDSDGETLRHFARMSQIHVALKPYLKQCVREYSELGVPVVRPIFFHFEDDERSFQIQDEYLLGPDLLVAPVLKEGATSRKVHLPCEGWVHLWSGAEFSRGDWEVEAPLGFPPVFYRADSPHRETFVWVRTQWGSQAADDALQAGSGR
jgi:alpha-glucosidase